MVNDRSQRPRVSVLDGANGLVEVLLSGSGGRLARVISTIEREELDVLALDECCEDLRPTTP